MTENFEDLLNQTEDTKVGDTVTAEVVKIEDTQLVVALPNGLQGAVPTRELTKEKDADIKALANIGDKIELVVVKAVVGNALEEGTHFILSKVRLEQRKVWNELEVGQTVEVTVTNTVRGGLTVDFKGVRGFIPASLIEDRFVSDFSGYKGKTFNARIEEVDAAANRFVLNRRVLVEAEKAAAKEEIFGRLHEGDVVEGTVARLTDFGAFVNLGGIDGLVHVSEVAHHRVSKPADVLAVGDVINVKILSINEETGRVSLSYKATQPGPWSDLEEKAAVGTVLTGVVKRLTTFGAFVEVFPGVEGLVHISQISHNRINTPQEVLSVGQEVEVKVLELDTDARRVGLSIKALEEAPVREYEEYVEEETYEMPEEEHGFTLGDFGGLADFKIDED
ncbi:MAG: 30S ribosomal protein S1 [Streptococcaceae bacterium]|jgi:small subunit ribosomal protein S1|nr:30S ribosomal protein S1 [Streptococcaceae bacterium]